MPYMAQGSTKFSNPADKLVLIVEDDATIMEFMEFVVMREGFTVEKAFDGEEGLWKAQNLAPDIILLDLMLPKFGGFEVLKELQDVKTINIPVVIMTGASNEFSREKKLREEPNVKEFVQKPVSPSAMADLLHTLLNTRPG